MQRRRKYRFHLSRLEYSQEGRLHKGVQRNYDKTRTRSRSTIGVALSRVVIERSYPDVALPFIENGSRMGSSKTCQGEKQGQHGVQMCLVNFKIKKEAVVDARRKASTTTDSRKECGSYQRQRQTSEAESRTAAARNRTRKSKHTKKMGNIETLKLAPFQISSSRAASSPFPSPDTM